MNEELIDAIRGVVRDELRAVVHTFLMAALDVHTYTGTGVVPQEYGTTGLETVPGFVEIEPEPEPEPEWLLSGIVNGNGYQPVPPEFITNDSDLRFWVDVYDERPYATAIMRVFTDGGIPIRRYSSIPGYDKLNWPNDDGTGKSSDSVSCIKSLVNTYERGGEELVASTLDMALRIVQEQGSKITGQVWKRSEEFVGLMTEPE